MSEEPNRLPRLSITRGFECHCSACGVYGFVATRVEALAEEREHRRKHKDDA